MTEVGADLDDFFEDLIEPFGHAVLGELGLERPGHASRQLVEVREHGVLVGHPDREALLAGDPLHVGGDALDA